MVNLFDKKQKPKTEMAADFLNQTMDSLKAVKEAQQVKRKIIETSVFLHLASIAHAEARDSTGGKFDLGQDSLAIPYYISTYTERLKYLISIYEANVDGFADRIDKTFKEEAEQPKEAKPAEKKAPAEELEADEGEYLDE